MSQRRAREARKAAAAEQPQRPAARQVLPPSIAKQRRHDGRKAFREFRQLPRAQRRPWEADDNPTTENDEKEPTNG